MAGDKRRHPIAISALIGGGIAVILAVLHSLNSSNSASSGGSLGTTEATIVAVITGFAGIIASVAGVLLVIRQVRSREQEAAQRDIERLQGFLIDERHKRIESEHKVFQCSLLLVEHGIRLPEGIMPRRDRSPNESSDEDLS
jgi:hypothetical protein